MGIPITGEVGLPAEPLRAFQVLTDPAVLRRAMPGLEELEPAQPEPGEAAGAWYRARLSLGLGPLRERYEGRAAVTDAEPGRFYRLLVRGQGPKGQLELAVEVALEPHPQVEGQTLVRYRGEAVLGGEGTEGTRAWTQWVGAVVVRQFFQALRREAQAAS